MIRRFILFLLFFFVTHSISAQIDSGRIVQVGAGEYLTTYRTDEGKLFVTCFRNNRYQITKVPVEKIMDVDGAQYTNVALDSSGGAFIIGLGKSGLPYAKSVALDASGKAFTGNSKVYGWYKSYLTLNNGNIYFWGEDLLGVNGGELISSPVLLQIPPGKKIRKLAVVTMNEPSVLALATDGSVWKYVKNKPRPEKVHIVGKARDITGVGAACYVVETETDLFAWGYLGSYLGAKDLGNSPVSIKKNWVAAGCIFPSKELVGNYNTLHIIDANNNMFGAGENIQGEIGNGKENPSWKNLSSGPYGWNWEHGQMITKPVQIPGKFKNLCTSNTITFYFYVQDLAGNWYSWGRNKARSLGNGITLSVDDEAKYPNAYSVPAPKLVTPLSVNWRVIKNFNPTLIPRPLANAGVNQYINSSNSILSGTSSSQQSGSITSYKWELLKGKGVILNSNLAISKITGLQKGENIFQLTVINHEGSADSTTVSVFVTGM